MKSESKIALVANSVLERHYIEDPSIHKIEDIILLENGFVQTKKMTGAQARLIRNGKRSLVTISENIKSNSKRRFVLAHELGHMILHENLDQDIHVDDIHSFIDWSGKRPEETEANIFAANLLMPKKIFIENCLGKKFSFELIESLCLKFGSGLISTSIRFSKIAPTPIAVIFSTDRIIKWASVHPNFPDFQNPLSFIKYNSDIPEDSVANYLFDGEDISKEIYDIEIDNYFKDDVNLEHYSGWEFNEIGIYLENYNSVITYIFPK